MRNAGIEICKASSAWVNALMTEWACWFCSPTCRAIRRAFNHLWSQVKGVPVNDTAERLNPIALVRLIAVARILMVRSPSAALRRRCRRQYFFSHGNKRSVRCGYWKAGSPTAMKISLSSTRAAALSLRLLMSINGA